MMIPSVLHTNWWALALRSLIATICALLTFLLPGLTLLVLVALFGIYFILNGLLTLVAAFRQSRDQPVWWGLVLEGVAGVVAGGLTLAWPDITLLALVYVVALWAIVTGFLQVGTAFRLRKHRASEGLMLLSGLLAIGFGVLLIFWPRAGALALAWWVGAYIFGFGMILGILAYRLRRRTAGHSGRSTMAQAAG
ncbi:HdeD family acid-resistance protein [Hymenobacter sp. BT770]|uniref:HdeD family acid-resistance protein n=1 Tax=Hymenobacter sp. BT770 TaxID=2886942 RepID=UPI001D106511|nr:HdeD family acid-resistance protein [Hymenobacter sp. BT770]MCC3154040.1 HdeD family acid-resistance protein [Hymenobacter sp. BT770]MDO3416184.1 HdeD family acid-resistance protein [Hymenobacter sp. BT770]